MNQIEQLIYNTRRFLTLVAASVLGLLLIVAITYAQTVNQKKTTQKQSTITPAEATTQLDGLTVTDTSRAAIRPFRINIPEHGKSRNSSLRNSGPRSNHCGIRVSKWRSC